MQLKGSSNNILAGGGEGMPWVRSWMQLKGSRDDVQAGGGEEAPWVRSWMQLKGSSDNVRPGGAVGAQSGELGRKKGYKGSDDIPSWWWKAGDKLDQGCLSSCGHQQVTVTGHSWHRFA